MVSMSKYAPFEDRQPNGTICAEFGRSPQRWNVGSGPNGEDVPLGGQGQDECTSLRIGIFVARRVQLKTIVPTFWEIPYVATGRRVASPFPGRIWSYLRRCRVMPPGKHPCSPGVACDPLWKTFCGFRPRDGILRPGGNGLVEDRQPLIQSGNPKNDRSRPASSSTAGQTRSWSMATTASSPARASGRCAQAGAGSGAGDRTGRT